MYQTIQTINLVVSILTSTFTLSMLIIKPFRNWILGLKKEKEEREKQENNILEVDRCLLRDRILTIYYDHYKDKEIKQYQFENLGYLYAQYKQLNGNSFVDKIWEEIRENWKIIE